nr:hypothetical protein [Tanacetum cinerariifolium]
SSLVLSAAASPSSKLLPLIGESSPDLSAAMPSLASNREAAAERTSDETEEMATVLTSMDAATVLASKAAEKVQEQIDAQVSRELEEQLEKEDQRRSEQIARDVKIARIHAEEELQIMIDGLDRNNETIAKYLQEYHQFASELPIERRIELISWKVKDFRGMTFEEVEAKFNSVWKQMEDFIPMGSKEEAERIKRKGLSLEQESAKKQKTSEEDYPLKKGLALVMISYKLQVENYSQMANDLILKIYKIANSPR